MSLECRKMSMECRDNVEKCQSTFDIVGRHRHFSNISVNKVWSCISPWGTKPQRWDYHHWHSSTWCVWWCLWKGLPHSSCTITVVSRWSDLTAVLLTRPTQLRLLALELAAVCTDFLQPINAPELYSSLLNSVRASSLFSTWGIQYFGLLSPCCHRLRLDLLSHSSFL